MDLENISNFFGTTIISNFFKNFYIMQVLIFNKVKSNAMMSLFH